MNEQAAPVKEGEKHDVDIKAVGEKGDGIARVGGFVLFVPGVKKGDFVKIKITKVLQNVGFAEVVEKLERPKKDPKFATVTEEELHEMEDEPSEEYDDTEDFGEDLVEED
jgi:predicted RNA-binding protein with TRAM domain